MSQGGYLQGENSPHLIGNFESLSNFVNHFELCDNNRKEKKNSDKFIKHPNRYGKGNNSHL